MSILDSFYLLFESDASKLDKGLEESRQKGRKLTEDLKAADRAAEGLGRSLGSSIRQLAGMAAGIVAVQSLAQSFLSAVDEADRLGESAERLGEQVENLGAWGDAVKLAGGDINALIGSVERLNEGLTVLDVTGKSRISPFLKELGINAADAVKKGQTALDLFPQIAEAMEGMSREQATSIGKRLGLDQGTIMLLMQGRREVEAAIARQKELGTITKEQTEISAKFNDELDNTRQAWRSVWLTISTAVLPAFTWVIEKVRDVAQFIRRHSDFVVGLLIAIAGAISVVLIPALVKAGIAAAVAFAPFLLLGLKVAALAAGFALLWDEIRNWTNGADSLIGRHLLTWEEFLDIIDQVAAALKYAFSSPQAFLETMGELIKRLVLGLLDFVGVLKPLEMAWDAVASKVRAFVELVQAGLKLARGLAGALIGAVTGRTPSATPTEGATAASGASAGPAGGRSPAAVPAGLVEGRQALAMASASPINSVTSSAISNSRGGDRSTKVDVGGVTVQTQATDAEGISRAVGNSLQSQLSQAAANYDDGVAA